MEQHFTPHIPREIKTEVSVKKKQQIEYVLEGNIRSMAGHFVWEINEETGNINKAEFKRKTAVLGAKLPPEELVIKPNCVYIPALNADNARKKYLKDKKQTSYYTKEPPMKLSEHF